MLRIGLTGGIGSGKTTVAHIFEVLGIPVYYADDRAKALMNEDPELKEQISRLLGPSAYIDGELDRRFVAGLVFNDPEKLAGLNSLVHPATARDADRWMEEQTAPYAIKEAALIFEAGLDKEFDYIIGVTAPEPLRIRRVMERDQTTREKVLERIRQQMDEQEKMKRCDFVINNDEVQAVIPQVLKIHQQMTVGR
ncbi:MAG TPA: dephospho-CoA kinase [Puia sp.]|nr:dephospho-CoA kinase [Puia sp.]